MPFAQHWNGNSWQSVAIPGDLTNYSPTSALDLSGNDAWVVGNGQDHAGDLVAQVDHWNGKHWLVVKAPAADVSLQALAGTRADDVCWLAAIKPSRSSTMTAPLPTTGMVGRGPNMWWNPPGLCDFAIAHIGHSRAAGYNLDDVGVPSAVTFSFNLEAHTWTGSGGSVGRAAFRSIVAQGPKNVFAFGYYFEPDIHKAALVLPVNGSRWQQSSNTNHGIGDSFRVRHPAPERYGRLDLFDAGAGMWRWPRFEWYVLERCHGSYYDQCPGAACRRLSDSPTDAWAVRNYRSALVPSDGRALERRRFGKHPSCRCPGGFRRIFPQTVFRIFSIFNVSGVAALGPNNVWVAGTWSDQLGLATEPLIDHWNGTTWSVAATPDGFDLGSRTEFYDAGLSSNRGCERPRHLGCRLDSRR